MISNQKILIKPALALLLVAGALFVLGCAAQPTTSGSDPNHTTGTVQANGVTLAYESFGPTDRETILFIAGTGQQLTEWPIELVEELVKRGYRVVIFDNRDVGLSTKFTDAGLPDSAAITAAVQAGKPPPFPYTLRDMANDSVGLLDALGIAKAHLAGMSMGGAIAQLIAIDHPDRTLSLTLLSTNSGNPAIPVIAKPEDFALVPPVPTSGDKQAFVEYQVQVFKVLNSPGYPLEESEIREWVQAGVDRSFDPAALIRHQTASLLGIYDGGYRYNHLKDINVPVVIVQGLDDPLTPVESAQDLAAVIPGAELKLIPGLGHEIPKQLVTEFADAIDSAAARA